MRQFICTGKQYNLGRFLGGGLVLAFNLKIAIVRSLFQNKKCINRVKSSQKRPKELQEKQHFWGFIVGPFSATSGVNILAQVGHLWVCVCVFVRAPVRVRA